MSFKFKTVKPGRIRGTKFSALLDGLKKDYYQSSAKWRKSVVDEIEGELLGTGEFWEKFDIAIENVNRLSPQFSIFADLQPGIVDKLQKFSNTIQQLNRAINISETYETDHVTMAPVNQRITLTIVAIDDLVDWLTTADKAGVSYSEQIKKTNPLRKAAVKNMPPGQKKTAQNLKKGLEKTARELRKVRALGEVIEREYNANPGKPIGAKQLRAGLKALKDSNGNIDIQEFKEKDLGLRDGNIAKFGFTLKADHENKSEWQRIQGVLRSNILGNSNQSFLSAKGQKMFNKMQKALAKDIGGITGSKSIEKGLTDQAVDIFKGKNPKKYKSSYKKKTSKGGTVRVPKGKKITAKTNLSSIYSISSLAARRQSREANSHRRDKGDLQQELNKLKVLINRRLPAEVRRNMGRPALINQTGRFSNSVRVENLLAGSGKTIIGEYTYQLSPYETFENTGVYQWPPGYNPKPLIARSIRNLALEYTEQKFTLRRT